MTVTGDRRGGLRNAQAQFPAIGDLDLGAVETSVLLVHGTADSDVPPAQSDHVLTALPHAELLAVQAGTHIATWTDPTSDAVQARIVDHLRAA